MKMRKRIAALIAVAMIASLMPMTAFAASTNRVSTIVKVTDDGKTKTPILGIELKDGIKDGDTFYLKLENAKWQDVENITTDGSISFTISRDGDTELAVRANEDVAPDTKEMIYIGLVTKDIKGEATVEIEPWDTPITAGKYVFATSSDKKARATIDDAPAFYTGTHKIAKITLEESALNAFADTQERTYRTADPTRIDDAGDNIEITLDNDDFEFVLEDDVDDYKITLGKGFSGIKASDAFYLDQVGNSDDQRFVITMKDPDLFDNRQRGTIEIELKVKSTTKRPELGDLMAEIGGSLVEEKEFVAATIAEYGVELKAEKDDYEFVAGQIEKVEFHLNEIVDDSMVEGRETEFSLPEGVYFETGSIKVTGGYDEDKTKAAVIYEEIDDNLVNGFSVKLPVDIKTIDEFKFEAKLQITSAFEGDVVLKAEGRSIGEDVEVTLAEVEAPVKVTVEPMKVKPGFREQVGGKIIIEETDKARLMQGKTIVLSLDGEDGMSLEDADIAITSGDLREDDFDVDSKDGEITFKVKRRSKVASTIEITNVKVKLDRSVPQGFYDIEVGGSAISKLAEVTTHQEYDKDEKKDKDANEYGIDPILGKEFIIVGDPITGVKSEVAFTIGSDKFLVDGVVQTMDAAAYIKDGRTMVPLRYLAAALGIDGESIKFNSGIVTIFVGNGNVVQVQVGSKDLRTNGMVIPMVAAAEIIDGRTYVPVTEIGGVFGVSGTWDAATQTATFK